MREIIARKQSSDPVQEQLREGKAEWNVHVSEFIKALIALKKAVNGRPVTELGLGKGNIKDPLPDVISTLLDRLSGEYERLTQGGKGIVQEQLQYSEDRHKPQEQGEVPIQQNSDDGINKEASNIFSRLLTYVSTPFRFGDEDKWERKHMLQSAAELDDQLDEIGIKLVSSDENAIPEVVHNTKILMTKFQHSIVRPMLQLNVSKNKKLPEKSEKPKSKSPKPEITEDSATKKDPAEVELPQEQFILPDEPLPQEIYQQVAAMEEDVRSNIGPNLTHIVASLALDEANPDPGIKIPMQELMAQLNSLIPDFYVSIEKKLDPIILQTKYNEIKGKFNTVLLAAGKLRLLQASNDPGIQKFAKGRLKRWLGRQKLSLFKDQDYRLRLNADSLITEAKVAIDKLMDILQTKNAPLDEMMKTIVEFSQIMSGLLKNVMELGDIHNASAKINKMQAKTKGKKFNENIISEIDIRHLDKFNKKLEDLDPAAKEEKEIQKEKKQLERSERKKALKQHA